MTHRESPLRCRFLHRRSLACALVILASALPWGCTKNLDDPLRPLALEYAKYPELTITLQDMDSNGIFFKSYHHVYKVMFGEKEAGKEELRFVTRQTSWMEVGKRFYDQHKGNLGMVLLSRGEDGKVSRDQYPPGYQYVGNSNYGQWKTNSSGGSFWEFYGKYALFSSVLNMATRPIYRQDYDSYTNTRRSGRPYYGPSGSHFGTNGTLTKKSNPTFYQRQQARQTSRNSSFSDKARSRSGTRGSSRSGK